MSPLFPVLEGGYTSYFVVQRDDIQRGPYGYIGPFRTPEEAEKACETLIDAEPASGFYVCSCGLDLDMAGDIEEKYHAALARLDRIAA